MTLSSTLSWRTTTLGAFLFLLTCGLLTYAVAFPPAAWAGPSGEEGTQQDDVQARVKKKLEKVLKLMRDNEAALLKLSTGKAAVPKKVDLEPPPQNEGGSASEGSSGGADGASGGGLSGEEISKKLDEMIKGQRGAGGTIPDELKQVVKMIPL